MEALCTWTIPQSVAIRDGRLGLLDKFLKIVFSLYAPVNIFLGGWKYIEEPAGFPTFWFQEAGMYTQQNSSIPASFCNNSQMDYLESADPSAYWNNKEIQCLNVDYAEAVRKTTQYGFVKTMVKRSHEKALPCSSPVDPCAALAASPGTRTATKVVGGVCSCSKLQDYFTLGVEQMTMSLQHAFTTSPSYHEDKDKETVYGSSTYKSSDALKKKVKTCVKKAGEPSGCFATFEPGKDIVFSIKEWLDLAGLDLDALNSRFESPLDGSHPTHRLSGVKIHVHISYEGAFADGTFNADLKVSAKKGWNSIGSSDRYVDFKSMSDKEYYDDYSYGISFDFFPSGKATRFDWQITFNTIIASLVLLSLSTVITSVVAFYVLPEKAVYLNAAVQQLEYDHTLAKFAVTTALACQAFKQWDTTSDASKQPRLDMTELKSVFRAAYDDETATQIASTIMDQAQKEDKPGVLYCDRLVDLMGDGLVSVAELRAHAHKKHGAASSSSKVAPAPAGDQVEPIGSSKETPE